MQFYLRGKKIFSLYRFNLVFELIFIFLPFFAQALLTANTKGTIQGTPPYLLSRDNLSELNDINNILSISFEDDNGQIIKVNPSDRQKRITAPLNLRLIDIKPSVISNNESLLLSDWQVADHDEDAIDATNTQILGSIHATWYNGDQVLTNEQLQDKLNDCGGPYKVTYIIDDVLVKTKYGSPDSMNYQNAQISYTFVPHNQHICYLQPSEMSIFTGTAGDNIKYANGYNSNTWQVGKLTPRNNLLDDWGGYKQTGYGFRKTAGFPTTGFAGAQFTVIGSGDDQSYYRCSTSSNDVTLTGAASLTNGENCIVTFNPTLIQKPTKDIVVNLEYAADGNSNWQTIDSYKIAASQITKWAISKGVELYSNDNSHIETSTIFTALDLCRGVASGSSQATTKEQAYSLNYSSWRQQYMFRRDEFSNSPLANNNLYPEGKSDSYKPNFLSRDIGTFFGEWGVLSQYMKSEWGKNDVRFSWTAERAETLGQFHAHGAGNIGRGGPIEAKLKKAMVVCRG